MCKTIIPRFFPPRRNYSDSVSTTIPYFEFCSGSSTEAFSEIIDVRTPSEHLEDHIPNAINLPVLTEDQRVEVGITYSKNKLEARKYGASLISENISLHLKHHFLDKPIAYKPLIYCWRGGQRSRSLALVLKEIGLDPTLVKFGYKNYRSHVRDYFYKESFHQDFDGLKILLISGSTGCGKSKILEALEEKGEQVLHLEDIAKHKGSILGNYPDLAQPTQKLFETNLMVKMKTFHEKKVIWVENESSKIGHRSIPRNVWNKMLESSRIHIDVDIDDRVQFVLKDYDYFLREDSKIKDLLLKLGKHAGEKKCQTWIGLVEKEEFEELVRDLIINYYDISYKKPRGKPIETFKMQRGLLLDPEGLSNSSFLCNLIKEGEKYRNIS